MSAESILLVASEVLLMIEGMICWVSSAAVRSVVGVLCGAIEILTGTELVMGKDEVVRNTSSVDSVHVVNVAVPTWPVPLGVAETVVAENWLAALGLLPLNVTDER